MKKKHIILILIVVFAGMLESCTQDDTCRKSRNVKMGGTFYLDTLNKKTNKRDVSKLTIDSLWVQGINIDSLLYKKKSAGTISVPLNQFAEECKFKMKMNKITDTLTIRYKNNLEFLSLECGNIRTQTIDTAFSTRHFIDSVAVIKSVVNTNYVENIQIYHIK